jgi:N-acetylmuramoyl-L-alanine amidase CwlA
MKLLQKKTLDDELEELKRQIQQTNGHLKSYSCQVMGTQKSVYQLAGRYNSYFNLKIPISSPTVDFSGLSYH